MAKIATAGPPQPTWRTALNVGFLCVLHALVVIIISAILLVSRPHQLGTWANVQGILAAGLAAIQYFPQIWMTYTLGHVGSLSIPMMFIQTPGGLLFAGSLAARFGLEGWSTWGVYLVSAFLQGVLLAMAIYFEMNARRRKLALYEDVSPHLPPFLEVAEKRRGRGENQQTIPFANIYESTNGTQIPEPLYGGADETDDEGGPIVENGHRSERTPLLDSAL
ncbi:MAG: hypothetical protein M1818_006199 [Claussenomyces sp. TS43310]|nr:MAG: hypothetical protein M1818_006199 [Claussenomyces sp. TS43310]